MLSIFWNSIERRIRAGWRLPIVIICVTILFLLLCLPLAVLAFFDFKIEKYSAIAYTVLAGALAITLILFASGRFLEKRPFRAYGFRRGAAWADLLAGIGLGALLMTGIFLVEIQSGWLVWQWNHMQGLEFWVYQVAGLLVFLAVGYYEELFARGFVLLNFYEGFQQGAGRWIAAFFACLCSSVFFALLHAGNPGMGLFSYLGLFLAGLFLALPYMLTGQLWFSIGLHWSWNFGQGFVFGFPVSGNAIPGAWLLSSAKGPVLWTGGRFGPEAGLLGFAAIGIGLILIAGYTRLKYGSIRIRLPAHCCELRNLG